MSMTAAPLFKQGDLAFARVLPATAKSYAREVTKFINFASVHELQVTTISDLDWVAAQYIRDLHGKSINKKGKSRAVRLLAGLVLFYPPCEGQLHWLTACTKGWAKEVPRASWTPMSIEMASLVAASFAKQGRDDLAVATLTSFGALLRIGEFTKIKRRHITFGPEAKLPTVAGAHAASIRLYNTKTKVHDSARVMWGDAASVLHAYVEKRQFADEDRVFPFSAQTFRKHFARTCTALGFRTSGAPLVPHSLRHGGATWLYETVGLTIEEVAEVGRWSTHDSVRTYLKSGRTLMLDNSMSRSTAELCIKAYTLMLDVFIGVFGKDIFRIVAEREHQWRRLRAVVAASGAPQSARRLVF